MLTIEIRRPPLPGLSEGAPASWAGVREVRDRLRAEAGTP
jgi:hypothetical protein